MILSYTCGLLLLISTGAMAQNLVKYVQPMAGTATTTTSSAHITHGGKLDVYLQDKPNNNGLISHRCNLPG